MSANESTFRFVKESVCLPMIRIRDRSSQRKLEGSKKAVSEQQFP